jgi:two-component system nitrate/nitrite response regulator NarP
MKIDVAIADGNALMLSALSEMFERDARFSLISATGSAEAFLLSIGGFRN